MFKIDRRLFFQFDMYLLLLFLLVGGMGLCNLYSASSPYHGYGMAPWFKQMWISAAMLGIMLIILCIDYKYLHTLNYFIYGGVVILLVVADFVGSTAGGSQRWIDLGVINLQPSELAKIALVITLASYYSRHDKPDGYSIKDLFLPFLLLALPFALIFIQPDLGTAGMLLIIFVAMAYIAKLRLWTWIISITTVVGGSVILICDYLYSWIGFFKPYQKKRIATFLNPEKDAMGSGYQILQSKIAIGSGGYTGNGYGVGPQGHLSFLPERHTDFAFAVLGEEWGFVGSFFFLAIYFVLLGWGLWAAAEAKDRFGAFLAYGVVTLIFTQAVINLFMVLGFFPVVGIPLPMVSYGGSSLLTTCIAFAILMNVRMRRFDSNAHH